MNRRQRQAQAEQSAAWAVMRADRAFLWLYAGAGAVCSLAGNLGHVWTLRHATEPPLWMAYAWAAVAPALLMLAAYAKPTLKRMLALGRGEGISDSGDGQDRITSAVVWAVFLGAFIWSAFGIYGFTVTLGVPASVAWIAPATIDVALFGALRGLVLTTPIAARMKEGLEPPAPTTPRPAAATVALDAPRRPSSTAVASAALRPRCAPLTEINTGSTPATAPTTAVSKPEPGAHSNAAVDAVAARIVTAGAVDAVAARIAASRATTQSAEVVAEIINARARGELKGPLARRLGLHHSAVQNVMDAAREPATAPTHLVAIH